MNRWIGLKVKEARLPRPEPEGDSGGSEPLVLCRACMKGFVIGGGGQPEVCPEGHRCRRPGADGGSGPSGGSEQVGADDAPGWPRT